ncbi:hypothetical protein BDN72DRAFT_394268 [Pluteus cervinus]|uniref:Uncharacterized protein n=1 Tax=Pluteus cervinus TaxID=181527 RepID=A0ACD3B2B5_9AGAR|nr:hypothetical protein BDN72DRAFT_394268 [Pluteus cervinus]
MAMALTMPKSAYVIWEKICGLETGSTYNGTEILIRQTRSSRFQPTVEYNVFQSLGRYTDPGPRMLPTQLNIGPVTLSTCGLACGTQGFLSFGPAYNEEC